MDAPAPPADETPDALRAALDERDARIRALEARLAARDSADAAARDRTQRAATLAGTVGIKAFAGADVTAATHRFWESWKAYLAAPRQHAVPSDPTRDLLATVLARVLRVRAIYLVLALIPSALILAQVFLLDQQNELLIAQTERFDRQNNLIAFEQTTNLRELLFVPPYRRSDSTAVENYEIIADDQLYDSTLYLWTYNPAAIAQILEFGRREPELVSSALPPLLKDRAPSVAGGALKILSEMRKEENYQDTIRAPDGKFIGAGLVRADLRFADLRLADLRSTKVSGADLKDADLGFADLRHAEMEFADLRFADLVFADLRLANLTGADLRDAQFGFADLRDAKMKNSELSGANMGNLVGMSKILSGANIFCVQGLDSLQIFEAIRNGAIINDSTRMNLMLLKPERDCSSTDTLSFPLR